MSNLVVADRAGAAPEEWSTDLEPSFVTSDSEEVFSRVSHVLRRTPNEVLVVHDGTRLQAFDSLGRRVRVLGREGQGPGEFRGINSIRVVGANRIAAFDLRAQRITHLDSLGAPLLIETTRISQEIASFPLADGGLVAATTRGPQTFEVGYRRLPLYVTTVSAGEAVEWADTLPGPGWEFATLDGSVNQCPFTHRPAWAATDSIVVAPWGASYSIAIFDLDGGLRRVLRRTDGPSRSRSPEDWQRAEAEWRFYMKPRGLVDYNGHLCTLQVMPPFSRLMLDSEGMIWVGRDAAWAFSEPMSWDVYSQSGDWVAVFDPPQHFRITEIRTSEILGVLVDELGREFPAIFEIERG